MSSLNPICLAMVLMLAGCAHQGMKKVSLLPARPAAEKAEMKVVRPAGISVSPAAASPAPAGTDTGLTVCDRELRALKRIDTRRYAQRRAQFDRLMSGASLYTDIRGDVTGGTRDAVDAMYRFRTVRLCAEISQDVLDALTRTGDSKPPGQN